jgi:hypothetical protein
MNRAADYGLPKIRVRKVREVGRWIFRRSVYEVEYTELGESMPAWVRETTDPAGFLRPCYGLADGHAVQDSADRQDPPGAWTSLFVEDAE